MNRFQPRLCRPVIAVLVFGFLAAKLDAQDLAVPHLTVPSDGAVLDNGRMDGLDVMRWEFEWAPVRNADKYRLMAQGKSAKFPAVNTVLADTRFTEESRSRILARHQQGWTWKVQARVNGKWGNWSEERTFDVEPLNTDLATIESPPEVEDESLPQRNVFKQRHEIDFDKALFILQPVASYPRYRPGISSREHLRFSADGKYIAIGGMAPGKPIGNGLISSGNKGRIELWNVKSGKQTILSDGIKTHVHPTSFPVAFSRDNRLLAAADTYGQVKIWDLSTENISGPKVIKFNDKERNSGIATALSFTPDSKRVLVGAYPTHQLEIESGKDIGLCEQYSSSLSDPDVIELSPDGSTIAFGGLSMGVNFFDCSSGKFSDTFMQESLFKQIYFYHFLPSGRLSVVAGHKNFGDKMVVINDNSTGTTTESVLIKDDGFYGAAVAVSLDGSTLAVADAKIRKSETYLWWPKADQNEHQPTLVSLWRINGANLNYLGQVNTGNKEIVTAIGLSPKGMTLVTSGANLRFWDVKALQTGQPEKARR